MEYFKGQWLLIERYTLEIIVTFIQTIPLGEETTDLNGVVELREHGRLVFESFTSFKVLKKSDDHINFDLVFSSLSEKFQLEQLTALRVKCFEYFTQKVQLY